MSTSPMPVESSRRAPLTVVAYDDSNYAAYAEFAERAWGRGCYQSSRQYLRWLYGVDRSPLPKRDDFLVAISDDIVVGCMHKMRLQWSVDGAVVEVPALHNWMVSESHRTGVGVVLLTRAMRAEKHAYISSAAGELATMYRKLRCQELRTSWYRVVVRPIIGAFRLGLNRLGGREPTTRDVGAGVRRLAAAASARGLELVTDPDDDDVSRMIASLAASAGPARAHPHWSVASFRWRFFHPLGPKHFCVRMPGARAGRDDFALIGIVVRRGLLTARIVELDLASPERARSFLDGVVALVRKLGVHVVLGYSAHPTIRVRLDDAGWTPLPDGQPSFLYHAPRELPFAEPAFNGSAADFAFESIRAS